MTVSSRPRGFRSIATWLMVWVLGSCGVIYVLSLVYSHRLSRELILGGAEREAARTAEASINEIEEVLRSVEESTRLLAAALESTHWSHEELRGLLAAFVSGNSRIFGSAAAFVPNGFDPSVERYSPYVYRRNAELAQTDLAQGSYRYWERGWYTSVETSGQSQWCEPYLDEGGGGVRMVTYSFPFFDRAVTPPKLRGVVTAGLALDWVKELVRGIRIGRTGYGVILSRSGHVVSHPDDEVMEVGGGFMTMDLRPEVKEIAERMLRGESGFLPFQDMYLAKRMRLTYAPVGLAGWSLAVLYPEDELMAEANRVIRRQAVLIVAGLVLLVGVVFLLSRRLTRPIRALSETTDRIATGDLDAALPPVLSRDELGLLTGAFHHRRDSLKRYIRDLKETTAAKQKLESELAVARKIQMSMLPKGRSGGGAEDRYELAASLIPARAVGGDLFAYFRIDGRLAFLVGDVSGKGVPAALFMARAKTLFETVALKEASLPAAMRAVNLALCAENEEGMFLTVFCGVLDLRSGELRYGSAGHDAPVILPARQGRPDFLKVEGGPVMGLLEAAEYPANRTTLSRGDRILLYTDGVSEALNEQGDFFTAQRLLGTLSGRTCLSAAEVSRRVMEAVRDFAGEAEQSDDITVLALQYGLPEQPCEG